MADATENNTNGCQLELAEDGYHMFLMSQKCGLIIVKFMYSRMLAFEYLKDDRTIDT